MFDKGLGASAVLYIQHTVFCSNRHSRTSCTRLCAGLDAVAFTLIVDDIVYPDGSTLMGVLGGGGTILQCDSKSHATMSSNPAPTRHSSEWLINPASSS